MLISLHSLLIYTSSDSLFLKYYYIIYRLKTIITPILGLILFKLICEILYKIVKACEIIIENHNNKND